MGAKGIVTASMLYVAMVLALAQGWIGKIRYVIQVGSGVA
jgi:hypothetical protein